MAESPCIPESPCFRAVLLDWRGTLATTPSEESWVGEAFRRAGRHPAPGEVASLAGRLRAARDRLDAPGVDSDADLHRRTYEGSSPGWAWSRSRPRPCTRWSPTRR